jgi:predicted Co/Zn/Cd cation transporter (cation efflux family)
MTVRQMFVFVPTVINEQQCREDALALIASGKEETVEIHKHKADAFCPVELEDITNIRKQLAHMLPTYCYRFGKETK